MVLQSLHRPGNQSLPGSSSSDAQLLLETLSGSVRENGRFGLITQELVIAPPPAPPHLTAFIPIITASQSSSPCSDLSLQNRNEPRRHGFVLSPRPHVDSWNFTSSPLRSESILGLEQPQGRRQRKLGALLHLQASFKVPPPCLPLDALERNLSRSFSASDAARCSGPTRPLFRTFDVPTPTACERSG